MVDRGGHDGGTVEKYRPFYGGSNGAVALVDHEAEIRSVSPAVQRVLGYDPEDIVGCTIDEYVHTEERETVADAIESARGDPDEPLTVAVRFRRADGSWFRAELTVRQLLGEMGGGTLLTVRERANRSQFDRQTRERIEEYATLFANIDEVLFILGVEYVDGEPTFRFVRASPDYETRTGVSIDDIRGRTPRELFGDDLGGDLAANYRRCVEAREPIVYEEELPLPNPGTVWETKLAPIVVDDTVTRIVGIARNVTDRVKRERALRQLYETAAMTDISFDDKLRNILAVGCEFLDLPYGFFTRIEGDTQHVKQAVGDHELLQPGESAPLDRSYCRKTIQSEDLVSMQDAGDVLGADDPAYELFDLNCYIGTKVLVGDDLYGTFCFAAPSVRDRSFTEGEREIVKLLGQWTGYELERQRFEDRLRGLHRVSQEFLVAETLEEVARIAVETGRTLFDLPVTACWEYDSRNDLLRPLAETERCLDVVGETPTFERREALVWEAFDDKAVRVYEEVDGERGAYNPETKLRSEVHVPLGDHGVIITGATEPRAFDDVDVESLRLLGVLVREAMAAVKREMSLVERGEALQRQNERLDEFTRIVAHDLRNPLSGAVGALEVARETGEDRFYARAEQSLQRMDDLIQELLEIARGERQAVDPRDLALAAVVEEAWSYIDAPNATLSVTDDLGVIYADETRLLQLLANLFRNSVEHAGEDVTVKVGRLPERDGFYVTDDGPGLPADVRSAIRDFGSAGTAADLGIGLTGVVDIVEAHGWELTLPDEADGACFEIRTDGEELANRDGVTSAGSFDNHD